MGVGATGISLEGLDAVPWDRLESGLPQHPVKEVPRTLRRLALAGGAATEDDCYPLFSCLAVGENGRVSSAVTAALPFVVALAADPGMGARVTLVEVLECLFRAATTAEPHLVDEEWPAAWRRHRGAVRGLLADPDPEVRRAAIPVADGVAPLLERWRVEADPAVRLPVLLALGVAAAEAADAATEGSAAGVAEHGAATVEDGAGSVEEARAVLAGVLRDGGPVMKVAATHAWACLDPDVPVRQADLLVEILTDADVRPQFEAVWWVPGVESGTLSREEVVSWTGSLFDHAPKTAASFVVRLADAADRIGDTDLCRASLDEAWRLLVRWPSAAPALLPVAGGLLANPDDAVRLKAANLLAMLGQRAAVYADRLATLVDDPGEDGVTFIDGTVGDYARWTLARIGDTRALPGLVEQLYEPYREHYSRSYCHGDPRLPDIDDVLVPLRAHADVLLPALRQVMRHHSARNGGHGPLTGAFLRVLEAWGQDALPALPEVVPLLDNARGSLSAADVLAAMGPAAASAEPALRGCTILDHPANHWKVAWAAWRIGGDATSALRLIGNAVLNEEGPFYGPVHLLADFGPSAAPYANRVRHIMKNTEGWHRIQAAVTLWSITGEPEPSTSVLEEFILPVADGDDRYGNFGEALRALTRIGMITPAVRTALRTVKGFDRRLSSDWDYRAFLQDEELRAAIEDVLALP
ncbi:HEAT repeat domain-containing protein [Streptomyces sp. NPDC002730]|uniref:HEAT repeat domain-containing protein n=1 Tax=Streptomyces sp. NPDC002730 TaxID=3364662 RepID=UPI0036D1EB31